nr:immunoglobulin heavy chain junction region [Macaca mulatta]MOV51402.1 immunoglobulin heavy chain junction region [Macaca mulatta]MOV52878.1 immunoglobulin heavy chain junction region [Macaca mulatta]MOV53033.1 immunoglobulin heavy chain junction region [Macaca mulatta]
CTATPTYYYGPGYVDLVGLDFW